MLFQNMKNSSIYLILFMLLCSMPVASFGQSHLKFKGIPLGSTIQSFTQQLEKKGFKQTEKHIIDLKNRPKVFYRGPFFSDGTDICILTVYFDEYTNKVTHVVVEFDMLFGVESKFKDFVTLYTEKYGEPAVYYTYYQSKPFDIPVQEPYLYSSIKSISANNCNNSCSYSAVYSLPEGKITLTYGIIVKYEEMGQGKHKYQRKNTSDSFHITYTDRIIEKKINKVDEL